MAATRESYIKGSTSIDESISSIVAALIGEDGQARDEAIRARGGAMGLMQQMGFRIGNLLTSLALMPWTGPCLKRVILRSEAT